MDEKEYKRILALLTDWFGDDFEDGELDALIFQIMDKEFNYGE